MIKSTLWPNQANRKCASSQVNSKKAPRIEEMTKEERCYEIRLDNGIRKDALRDGKEDEIKESIYR